MNNSNVRACYGSFLWCIEFSSECSEGFSSHSPGSLSFVFAVNTMDTSDAEGDAADPDDRPTCPPATGLQFLNAVPEDNVRDEDELGDGDTEWMCRPRKECGGMEDANNDWCPSPRPMNDAAESDGVEEWIASPRNKVAAEPAETVATQPVAPPPRAAPPPIRPLTDEEKKEKAYLKAQKSYMSDWLPKFDWLILDKTLEGDPFLRCSVCMEHGNDNARYGRNGAGGRDLQIGSIRWH
ncbi:unnamed protein product [Closterium sp. Yama58-4]|nr:unnamed protein product [Closterium sp. Yama58-4]